MDCCLRGKTGSQAAGRPGSVRSLGMDWGDRGTVLRGLARDLEIHADGGGEMGGMGGRG